MLGMIIQDKNLNSDIPSYVWAFWIFSPIVLPIMIGMMLVENKPKSNNHE
jgi:hypothetical protein